MTVCGIAGFLDFNGTTERKTLVAMTDSLAHRGPDGAGYDYYSHGKVSIGLGHRRLSIIDLSTQAAQPMRRGDYSIVLNGEIYNYREIKDGLQSSNVGFETDSDTEVILAAFERWGPDCISRLRGMFAVVIYDHRRGIVHFFRDRLGVKPLFIYQWDGLLLFASELKAFHQHPGFEKKIDRSALSLYFRYGFVPEPECIFSNVRKLPPGSYLSLDLSNGEQRATTYWDASALARTTKTIHRPETELLEEIDSRLQTAFDYRMVADVPVGIFLSGGYDSSLVTAMLQKDRTEKLKTFTIGFESERYNEAHHARAVAEYLSTEHTALVCTEQDAQAIVADLPNYYDEPFADSSAIPTFLVSRLAAGSVKVALSSDGGDELFSGYSRNLRFQKIYRQLNNLPAPVAGILAGFAGWNAGRYANDLPRSVWWEKFAKVLRDNSLLSIIDAYPSFTSVNSLEYLMLAYPSEIINPQDKLRDKLRNIEDRFNGLLAYDYQSTLTNDMLVKVDRATMAASIEGREPMLDHELYEYLLSVPSAQKMKNGQLKYLLKKITHRYLPAAIMDRPKQGFGIPIGRWLKTDLRGLVEEHLNEQAIARYGLLHPQRTKETVNRLTNSKRDEPQLWLLLTFQMWCAKWL
ncbi:asparagine synthase (glutamine-hydrolyzing) [Lewinellaceae bacterium SD302]|nr:asparagine synthase (glutamine-hydrolyzing) [Lewinellaceae bacterium SD302]